MIIVSGKSKTRFFAIRFQPQCCLRCIFRGGEILRRMILSKTIPQEVNLVEQAVGESEFGVASDRPIEKTDRLGPILARHRSTSSAEHSATAKIKIVGLQILRGLSPNLSLFVSGEGCFELGCDRLRDFTLECEDVLHFPVVLLRPNLCVCLCVDELGVNANAVARNLHASLQNVCNAQVAPDLLHLSLLASIRGDSAAADDLQISDFP